MSKLRVVHQGRDVLVLGTDQIREAADFAGMSNEKGIFWDGSFTGPWVRRKGKWEGRSDYMPPKDSRPGVMFAGVCWPDSSGPWRDNQGDVWWLREDGRLHTPETMPFDRAYVEKKWGPLIPIQTIAETGTPV